MRKSLAFVPILAFAWMGCSSGDPIDTAETGDTDEGTIGVLEALVVWSDDGATPTDTDSDGLPDEGCGDSVTITITDPAGETNWLFGMAETGAPTNGWYGEDCIGGQDSFTHCHDVGLSATLIEVPDCLPTSVVSGTSTLLDAGKDDFLTYYIEDSAGACFAWGHDVSYYDACTEMVP